MIGILSKPDLKKNLFPRYEDCNIRRRRLPKEKGSKCKRWHFHSFEREKELRYAHLNTTIEC